MMFLSVVAAVAVAAWVPVGPDGGNVMALAIAPSEPATMLSVLYANDTVLPVYRTTDAGAAWSRVGGVSRVAAVVIDPFDPMYVYSLDGGYGVNRSTDGGATWEPGAAPFSASAVGCDPFVPGRLYVAGAYYDSITTPAYAVSTDRGESWAGGPVAYDTGSIYVLDVSAADSGTVFLGGEFGQLYVSTDAGETWESRSSGFSHDDIILALSASHGDPGIVCAGSVYGMFRTTDAGVNWVQVSGPRFVMSIDFSPAEPNKGYAYGYDTADVCFSTTDAGVTWQPMARIAPTARFGGLTADPALGDGAWCPTAAGVMRSTDRGGSWVSRNAGIYSADISTISVPGWNREHVYLEVAGVGVYKSLDAGRNWDKCTDFLSCGNICGIGLARGTSADKLYALEGAG
jgi:photosystem II stability/assembly factor-like uncharacterized protein